MRNTHFEDEMTHFRCFRHCLTEHLDLGENGSEDHVSSGRTYLEFAMGCVERHGLAEGR